MLYLPSTYVLYFWLPDNRLAPTAKRVDLEGEALTSFTTCLQRLSWIALISWWHHRSLCTCLIFYNNTSIQADILSQMLFRKILTLNAKGLQKSYSRRLIPTSTHFCEARLLSVCTWHWYITVFWQVVCPFMSFYIPLWRKEESHNGWKLTSKAIVFRRLSKVWRSDVYSCTWNYIYMAQLFVGTRNHKMSLGSGGAPGMVMNLNQNPNRRPIASAFVPTLLQQGLMWVCRHPSDTAESRWYLDDEHLLIMGWPMFPALSTIFQHPLLRLENVSATHKKSLAGNATQQNHDQSQWNMLGAWMDSQYCG